MTTCVEGQGTIATSANTVARTYCDYSGTADYNAKYTSDINSTGIRINGDDLLTNKLICADPYCLDAGSWQSYEPKITLDETFVNQITEEIARKLSKQNDPIEMNYDVDEVEIPPMSGFVEI